MFVHLINNFFTKRGPSNLNNYELLYFNLMCEIKCEIVGKSKGKIVVSPSSAIEEIVTDCNSLNGFVSRNQNHFFPESFNFIKVFLNKKNFIKLSKLYISKKILKITLTNSLACIIFLIPKVFHEWD